MFFFKHPFFLLKILFNLVKNLFNMDKLNKKIVELHGENQELKHKISVQEKIIEQLKRQLK